MTPSPCTRTDHVEWANWRDDGRVIALICAVCGATAPPPEVEPGERLVPLPAGWEDEDE